MIQKIAFIGVTGNLAPYTYNEFLKKGIQIKALVRNPNRLKQLPNFPSQIDIIKGDLNDLESLRELMTDVDAIYLNLSTQHSNAVFQPEIEGIKNIIEIAKEKNIKRIFHLSAITVMFPEFAQGRDVFINKIRKTGYKLLKESGIPCTFFHLSWIMETIEFTMRDKNTIKAFKPIYYPIYWLSGKDLGKMISNAVNLSTHNETKDYIMQGKEAITFEEALTRYANTFQPKLKLKLAPIWMLKFIGIFNKEARKAAQIGYFFSNYKEEFRAEQTWLELGKPQYTIDNFSK